MEKQPELFAPEHFPSERELIAALVRHLQNRLTVAGQCSVDDAKTFLDDRNELAHGPGALSFRRRVTSSAVNRLRATEKLRVREYVTGKARRPIPVWERVTL